MRATGRISRGSRRGGHRGTAPVDLLRISGGEVLALDLLPQMLERTKACAAEAGVLARPEVLEQDMAEMDFPPASFDVVWSEGAIYNLGFETGRLLRSHGGASGREGDGMGALPAGSSRHRRSTTRDRSLPGELAGRPTVPISSIMGGMGSGLRVIALAALVLSCARHASAQDLELQAFSTDEAKLELRVREQARTRLLNDPVERARLIGLARRERTLAITAGTLYPVAMGFLFGAMTQWEMDFCLDLEGTSDCSGSGSSKDGLMAALAVPGLVIAAGSWGTSIAAGATGLRLSHDLERHGLAPSFGSARSAMVLSSVPFGGTFGIVSPWISLAHSNRAREALGDLRARRSSARRSVFVQAGGEAGRGYGLVQLRGAF